MAKFLVRPPNSIIFIADREWTGDPPINIEEELVTFTEECIVSWTRPENDGDTEIIINEPNIGRRLISAGIFSIRTPSKFILVSDSHAREIAFTAVKGEVAQVELFFDNLREPTVVRLLIN